MNGFDILILVGKKEYTEDSLGQRVGRASRREVISRVESVSQSEFFSAGQIGLTPEYKAILAFAEDYDGEELAEFDGKLYAIYRTYKTKTGQMELYLKRETGAA